MSCLYSIPVEVSGSTLTPTLFQSWERGILRHNERVAEACRWIPRVSCDSLM